jgi:hypothetical protein
VKRVILKGMGARSTSMRRAALAVFLGALALGMLAPSGPVVAQAGSMGPQDVAVIPIESVPAWVSEGVMRWIPEEGEGGLEVLAVVRDPRDVPVDRFLYALTEEGEVMAHPQAEAIRQSLAEDGHSAVAAYVRVTAPAEVCADCYEGDPFHVDSLESMSQYPASSSVPWNNLGVAYEAEGVTALPCLEPMTIGEGVRPFRAPVTGATMRPDEYQPPAPQYVVKDNRQDPDLLPGEMAAGEVREGWVLCLAPDVPADEVRLVRGPRFAPDGSVSTDTLPVWVPYEEMAVGEWYLLEDRQVVAWNEGGTPQRGGEPVHLDEQMVYEGDVWVSVGQALRHVMNPAIEADGTLVEPFEEELRLQMYFEGMDELLSVWDVLELQGGMELSSTPQVEKAPGYTERAEPVQIRAEGSSVAVNDAFMVGEDGVPIERTKWDVVWIYPGDLRHPAGAGPISVWRAELEELDERDLTTQAICAVTECVPVPRTFAGGMEVQVPTPAVSVGSKAFGVTVRSVRVVQPPVLLARGLDVVLWEGRAAGGYKWLVAEVEVDSFTGHLWEGLIMSALNLRGAEVESGEFPFTAEQYQDFGSSGGRASFGNRWASYLRSGTSRVLFVSEVPEEWQLEDVVLVSPSGPAWRLQ